MTTHEFALRLQHACASVMAAEQELTEIDSKFGDADHGLTMTKIAKAISAAVEASDGGIQTMLDDAAMAVMSLNGGSAVPLWNTWLDGMQEAAPEGDTVDIAGIQAMKLAKKAGLNVRQVVTGEEIQFDPNGEDNKRGLAGAVALYHIAAAAAREGKSLDEVAEIAQHYADNMASITVKSTDATHPQNGMSFGDLGETDLMEIGAGQHGEGGGIRVPMMSAKETVATVAEALSKNLDLKAGDKAFVMINGCGATTMMEMLVLFKDTVEFLKAKGVEVVASMVGEILTVQEAGGFQMNIAKWDDECLRLWNTPCHTPAYSKE